MAGEIERLKFGAALITRNTVVLCVRLPLVPVIVRVYVPMGVEQAALTFIVKEDPENGKPALKVAAAPEGRPETVNVTPPVNPFNRLMLIV